jgi:lipoprotein-releasing system permease protein
MRLTRFLALRYFSPDRGWRIPYLTLTAIVTVAVAVSVQIVVLSVMRGFRADLMKKFLGLNPHLRLTRADHPPDIPGIRWLPGVEGHGILDAGAGQELGIRLRGVTPEILAEMPSLEWSLPVGQTPLTALGASKQATLIGSELASLLGLIPGTPRRVTLIAPFGQISPAGDLIPNRITVPIEGLFRSGLYEADQALVLMGVAELRQLLGPQLSEQWWGYMDDPMRVGELAQTLRAQFPDAVLRTWQEENAALLGALALERRAMMALLLLVVGIAATGVVAVLFLLVSSRHRDMGILLALGCTPAQIRRVFIWHGAMIGGMGSLLGIAVALALCMMISHLGIPLPDSLYVRTLPILVSPLGLMAIALGTCAITMFAAYWPVREIGQGRIMEQLKYE